MNETDRASFLQNEFKQLCVEQERFHEWAIQANSAIRIEYNKHLDHLREKRADARQRLKMLVDADDHLKDHMNHAAERAIEAFHSALADAKAQTNSAQSQPPFLY